MNKLKVTIIILVLIIIGLGAYIAFGSKAKHVINSQEDYSLVPGQVSPLVDRVNMVNTKGQHVDLRIKGTFREVATGKIFESGGLGSCIKDGCKRIYMIDCTYEGMRPGNESPCYGFSDKDNPHIGTIESKKFYSSSGVRHVTTSTKEFAPIPDDKIIYTVSYNDKLLTFEQGLCIGPGSHSFGYQCENESLKAGDRIYFTLDSTGKIKSTLPIYGTATVADLLSYQYFAVPDTGEAYPVVVIQK